MKDLTLSIHNNVQQVKANLVGVEWQMKCGP